MRLRVLSVLCLLSMTGSTQADTVEPSLDVVRLVPTIRVEPLNLAIPTIPLNAIQPFLMQTNVVELDELEAAPYVVDFANEHVLGGAGDRIYVRGLPESKLLGYLLFRAGNPYKDAETGEILGYDALYVADAKFESGGDPAIMLITKSNRDVRIGDKILPVALEQLQMGYQTHFPVSPVKGHIIAVVDGVSQIGQYNIVVIDRGRANGIEIGHVLNIYKSGRNRMDPSNYGETIYLPTEKEGLLMVFHPYERVSFALILSANRAIQLNDSVLSPF